MGTGAPRDAFDMSTATPVATPIALALVERIARDLRAGRADVVALAVEDKDDERPGYVVTLRVVDMDDKREDMTTTSGLCPSCGSNEKPLTASAVEVMCPTCGAIWNPSKGV